MKIITSQKSETREYAALELKKYITKMSRGKIFFFRTFFKPLFFSFKYILF